MTTMTSPLAVEPPQRGPVTEWQKPKRDTLAAVLFLLPAAVLFLVFILGPLLGAIVISLFDWELLGRPEFSGFDNFGRLLSDPMVGRTLLNTAYFAVVSVVLQILISLLLAVGVNRAIHSALRYVLTTAYFFPFLISWASVALLWKFVLDPNFGFLQHYAGQLGIGWPNVLIERAWAMPALIGVDIWRTMGFTFVILLAGLQAIPKDLYESAVLDGAGAMRRFWHVTIPLLSPTLFFATTITVISSVQVFEPMFIMTQGGPSNTTESIVMYIYETGFRRFEMGYASTLALLVFVIILLLTLVQFRVSRRWVHYD